MLQLQEHASFLIKFFSVLTLTVGSLMTYEMSTKDARIAKQKLKDKENTIRRLVRLKKYEEIASKRIRY